MIRLAIGGGLAALCFSAGLWTGNLLAVSRQEAVEAGARAARDERAAEVRAAEAVRLRVESALDLQLGKVIEDAEGLDGTHIVFGSERVRRLFPAGD